MNLIEQVYKIYEVEPIKVPQFIPSTGECIGYDNRVQEWNELKCYRIIKRLTDLGIRVDISKPTDYCVMVRPEGYSLSPSFIFTEEDKSLENCMLKVLITLYDEIIESHQKAIRNVLGED